MTYGTLNGIQPEIISNIKIYTSNIYASITTQLMLVTTGFIILPLVYLNALKPT
jgi:hypothetical protein